MTARRLLPLILLLVPVVAAEGALKVPVEGAGRGAYRLGYTIRGGAISRLLFIFPLRVFYESAATVDLRAIPQADGSVCFAYTGVPRTAYIMRTLGFSGKSLALLTVGGGEETNVWAGMDDILARWRIEAPEFDVRVKTIKRFPHRLQAAGTQPFAFMRDVSGNYRDATVRLEPRYVYHPSRTGIYFNVFPMLADLLKLLNHRFLPVSGPAPTPGRWDALPAAWEGEDIDLSADLNRMAALMEKAVESLVTIRQKAPFRLRFHVAASSAEALEICGEAHPDVPVWKGFMIREVFRRVRLRPADGVLLSDEFWLGIRNAKGQGGFGRLLLERIDSMEVFQ
jgi:hypothetical protein